MGAVTFSPPKMTYRRSGRPRPERMATSIRAQKAVGVWLMTVTRWSAMTERHCSGVRLAQWESTTSSAPVENAHQISHTEKSNDREWKSSQRSSEEKSNTDAAPDSSARTLAWRTG